MAVGDDVAGIVVLDEAVIDIIDDVGDDVAIGIVNEDIDVLLISPGKVIDVTAINITKSVQAGAREPKLLRRAPSAVVHIEDALRSIVFPSIATEKLLGPVGVVVDR